MKAYEAIVKGHNIPEPGVPESFKVLLKELQSLCLDVRILDKEGNEIELKDDDEDDFIPNARDEYRADEGEIESSGYTIEDAPEDAGVDAYDSYGGDDDEDESFPGFSGGFDMEEE